MIKGNISKIESMGLSDGPGIRTVIFLSGCKLKCGYCHNPEMQKLGKPNFSPEEVVDKIKKYKPYYKQDGGVTISGGEPLLQKEFLIELCKLLKKEDIHIALDTSGVGAGDYEEILSLVDLVLFDIKHTTEEGYKYITKYNIKDSLDFINYLNKSKKPVWIRQVIIPGINDDVEYLKNLKEFLKKIDNVQKTEFLPYHKLGEEKYKELGMESRFREIESMDKQKCDELFLKFTEL